MVRLQVHAPQPRQPGSQTKDASHVGESPGIDGLVVIAHEEDVAAISCQQQCQLQLRAVQVLRLVDEEDGSPRPPARQQRRVGRQRRDRQRHEVVEVDGPALAQVRLVGGERLLRPCLVRHRSALRVELEARECIVEPARQGRLEGTAYELGQHLLTLDDAAHVEAGIGEDLPAQRMEGANTDRARCMPQFAQRGIGPILQLVRGSPVERQRAHGRWVCPPVHAPGEPCHDRRRLARPGRRHAEYRAGWAGGRGSLVLRQSLQASLQRRVDRRVHGAALARSGRARLTRRLRRHIRRVTARGFATGLHPEVLAG